MVQKQAALRDGTGDDFFAEDDPLAELARIVGFETPHSPKPVETERHEPAFDLEDELLREFETYDAPTPAPQFVSEYAPVRAQPEALSLPSVEEQVFETPEQQQPAEDVADAYYPESIELPQSYEAQAFAPEPAYIEDDSNAREQSAFGQTDLADELELAIADFPQFAEQAEMQSSPEPVYAEPSYSEPSFVEPISSEPAHVEPGYDADELYEPAFAEPVDELQTAPEQVQTPEQPIYEEPVAFDPEPEIVSEEMYDAPARTETRVRLPLTNFTPSRANLRREPDVEPVPAPAPEPEFVSASEPEPVLSDEDFFAEEELFADQASAVETPFDWTAPAAAYEAPTVEPAIHSTQVPAFSQEPAGQAGQGGERHEPEVDFAELEAELEVAPEIAAPSTPAPLVAPAAEAKPALAAEDEFDPFADTEFELALDDIELDLSDLDPEPVAKVQDPQPVQSTQPAPVMAHVARQPDVAPTAVAPRSVVQPAAPAPQPAADTSAAMPFDLSQIAEQDEPLTTMATLDVPDLPAQEAPAEPNYKPDYGIDVDAELETMFAAEAAAETAQPASTSQPSRSAAAAAATSAPAQPDFQEFERALRQDLAQSSQGEAQGESQRPRKIALQQAIEAVPAEGSSRRWLLAASVAFIAIIGAGGLYAWMGGSPIGLIETGEPVVILADKDPVKVVPENRGGASVPNQDKAVYDRVEGAAVAPKQESLISSSEEPVDVVQRTLLPQSAPDDGADADVDAAQSTPVGETEDPRLLPNGGRESASEADDAVTITPRKVRTMIVRPDGTLVAQDVLEEPAPQAPASEAAPTLAESPVESAAEALAASTETATTSADTDAAASAPLETAATSEPEAVAEEPVAPAPSNTPIPRARPSEQPSNVVATVTEQGNVTQTPAPAAQPAATAPAASAAPAPVETASALPPGTYVVQVASLPSEAEAQKSYRNLSARYSSIIGGRGVDIKRADISGKGTYYRVRIPAGTRDQAISMCESLKAAGGSCLVAR